MLEARLIARSDCIELMGVLHRVSEEAKRFERILNMRLAVDIEDISQGRVMHDNSNR